MTATLSVNLSDIVSLHMDAGEKFEFTYDSRVGRYRYKDSGQFVSKAAFSQLTQLHILGIKKELRGFTTSLLDDDLSFRDWQRNSARTLRTLHLQEYILGKGGAKNMTPQDMKVVREELKFQLEHLRGFAGAIKEGKLSNAQIKARSGMYAASGKKSYSKGANEASLAGGKTEYKNILYPGESCEECITITKKKWQPIGSQKPIGDRTCLVNCNCQWEYR